MKSAADSRFQAVNRAFEILSDSKRRMIYDSLGEEGLKTSWEIGSKYKTSEEVSYFIIISQLYSSLSTKLKLIYLLFSSECLFTFF